MAWHRKSRAKKRKSSKSFEKSELGLGFLLFNAKNLSKTNEGFTLTLINRLFILISLLNPQPQHKLKAWLKVWF